MSKEFINAVAENHLTKVRACIEAGEDPSQLNREVSWNVTSPLHIAAYDGNDETFRTVLAAARNVNVIDGNSNTPLRLAIIQDRADRVQMLLDAGANVNLTGLSDGTTPLHDAARGGPEVLKLLLKAGANVNLTNREGEPPLASVRFGDSPETAEALIAAGAAQQLDYVIPEHTTQEYREYRDGRQESVTRVIPAIRLEDELRKRPEMSAAIDRGIEVASVKQAAREAGDYSIFSDRELGRDSLQAKAALIVAEQARLTMLKRAKLDAARVAARVPARVDPLAAALRDRARQAADDLPAQPPIPLADRQAAFVEAALAHRGAAGGVAAAASSAWEIPSYRPEADPASAVFNGSAAASASAGGGGVSESKGGEPQARREVHAAAALRRQQEQQQASRAGGAASTEFPHGYPAGHRPSSPRDGHGGGGGVGGR